MPYESQQRAARSNAEIHSPPAPGLAQPFHASAISSSVEAPVSSAESEVTASAVHQSQLSSFSSSTSIFSSAASPSSSPPHSPSPSPSTVSNQCHHQYHPHAGSRPEGQPRLDWISAPGGHAEEPSIVSMDLGFQVSRVNSDNCHLVSSPPASSIAGTLKSGPGGYSPISIQLAQIDLSVNSRASN
ncbi:unnamed protein product [Protopolystoma xenopodis]|uniref:Uncharacterized protein n=1 Tax=Protopolystoma xenopodis TaxID=117903 RepID=A0A448XJI7_9PLAT|nr:unnamed protein product [Protopolystoma xenopodis]